MGDAVTNADLMREVMNLSRQRAEDHVLLTTLRDSHKQRAEGQARFEMDTRVKLTAIEQKQNKLTRQVATMEPTVKRVQARDLVRRALARCVLRWWKIAAVVGSGVTVAVAWLNEWLPKIAALLRKIGSP